MLHADLTLLSHTHQVAVGLASLFTAYMRCMQVLPLLLRTCVAGATAYPCRGAIARCALVRRAEGVRSRLLGPVSYVANVNNEIIVAFFPQPLPRKQHLYKKNRFSFLRNMLSDEETICLRKECLSELLLETEFLAQT